MRPLMWCMDVLYETKNVVLKKEDDLFEIMTLRDWKTGHGP